MLTVKNTAIRNIRNFWNHCLFHPTDAIEDPWGKRILDRMASDGSIQTVRIYAMLEDIVYTDETGVLQYDFRLSDLRLDYMVEKGYDLLIAYAGMPDCIAKTTLHKTNVAKNKTRYKGKMFNTSPPADYAQWEEVCYQYTKHNVERYGLARVSGWHCHCFNEPDIPAFFLSELPFEAKDIRLAEYCKLYAAFQRGVRRVSEKIPVGGPALAGACQFDFLGGFLDYVKHCSLKLDFISWHNYGTEPHRMENGTRPITVSNSIENQNAFDKTVKEHGFDKLPVIVDEWGAATGGFCNKEDFPSLMFRETEVFSAYYAKLICEHIRHDHAIEKMMLCLSGQHEMTEDFSGFRNFFTLNFIAKPIYNAHRLAAKLGNTLLEYEEDRTENLYILPTKKQDGGYAVLLSYSAEYFEEDLAPLTLHVNLPDDIFGQKLNIWCIDKTTTNPYRLSQKIGDASQTPEGLQLLRKEGQLMPVFSTILTSTAVPALHMTANSVFLIETTPAV